MSDRFFDNKSIWITGGQGFVGKALVRRLDNENAQVKATSRHEVDITDKEQVQDWLSDQQPDIVIHTAAKVGNIEANRQQPADFLVQNLAMGTNIVTSCAAHNIAKLVNLGSSCIYPKLAQQPIVESALLTGKLEPTNEGYAIAKVATLKLVESYRQQYHHNFINLIPTNLYGIGDHFDLVRGHVIPSLMVRFTQAVNDNSPSVRLWGTGSPEREFLFVDDAADAICFLTANYQQHEPINIAGGNTITIKKLAQTIAKLTGFTGEILWDTAKPDGMAKKQLCHQKITALGWQATTSFEQGLRAALADYQSSDDYINNAERK